MRLFWLITLLFPLSLVAQHFPVDAVSGKIYFAEEVLVKDGPQTDLYHRAKAWLAADENKAIIQVDDVTNGLLIGSNYCILSIHDGTQDQTWRLWYKVKLQMEDDRYWYSLSDFRLQKKSELKIGASKEIPVNQQALEAVVFSKKTANQKEKLLHKSLENAAHKSILALISSLKKSMF